MRRSPRRTCRAALAVTAGLAALVSGFGLAGRPAAADGPKPGQTAPVDYNREVRPILAKNCFACHGQDEGHRAKGLRLDRRESAVAELPDGALAIVPGDPEASDLIGAR